MAFISSLGNVMSSGSGACKTTVASSQDSSVPTSIQLPGSVGNNNAVTFKNPFSAFAPPVSRESTAKAEKINMMSAFSGLDLALDENGQVKATNTLVKDSAARDLLASKLADKKAEQDSAVYRKQKQDELLLAKIRKAANKSTNTITSSLSQAIGSFSSEVEGRDFISNNQRRRNKGSQTLSRRARQKKEKAKERAEAYEGKQTNKSQRTIKRQQRKEKYKHVY